MENYDTDTIENALARLSALSALFGSSNGKSSFTARELHGITQVLDSVIEDIEIAIGPEA